MSVGTEDSPSTETRAEIWLELLRSLTAQEPEWLVLKHPESGLYGTGDVDSAAPRRTWPRITEEFRRWANMNSLGPVIVCPHAPGWLHLIALDPTGGRFWELDVNDRKYYRGSLFFTAEDLLDLCVVEGRGFRRLRDGAEGMIKLFLNGCTRSGGCDPTGLSAKNVPTLLATDPEGVVEAARLFGTTRSAALRGATACAAGEWDRRSMAVAQLRFAARALARPSGLLWRARTRRIRESDPVLVAVFDEDRHTPSDVEAWISRVSRDHTVYR